MRLNRYLASCGIASRRAAEKLINDGLVVVNGKKVVQVGTTIEENRDVVMVQGRIVRPVLKKIYIALHKPKGYVTTVKDEKGRKDVLDLVPITERIFPVGRLDLNSEGLLLLTNDGLVAERLTHPRFKITKIYRVRLDRPFEDKDFVKLTTGVELDDGMTAPCQAHYYTETADRIEIRLREGRNRQVKRMMEALGYQVRALKRVQIGPLRLDIKRGEWRFLKRTEIKQLFEACKLS